MRPRPELHEIETETKKVVWRDHIGLETLTSLLLCIW